MTADPVQISMMELADLGNPRRIAREIHRQLRAQYESMPLRCPLDGIAKAVGIVGVKDIDTKAFEGTLVIKDGKGAIGLRRAQRPVRRNFTFGHELGHFLIPSHRLRKNDFRCSSKDTSIRSSGRRSITTFEKIEIEANEFAAELLVPDREFKQERRKLGGLPDVTHIRKLAGLFDVSQEMMAKVYIDKDDDPCAVVISKDGIIKRPLWSEEFPFLGLKKGDPLPYGSVSAGEVNKAAGHHTEVEEIDAEVWFDQPRNIDAVHEQVIIQIDGWAMTLIRIEPTDPDEEIDDSDWNRRTKKWR